MAQRMPALLQQHSNSAGTLYSGGTLSFYATASSTPLAVYSDAALSTSLGTSITLNSAGRPSTDVWLQNTPYKIVLADSSGNIIWTADPVSSSDFASFPITKVGSGTPTGSVAGTAGSSGVLPTMYWDYTNSILYACTTTGTTSTAVWASINPSAATTPALTPQGRLTLTSATPILATEVAAATSVFYTPFNGVLVPVYNGSVMINNTFAELTLSLVSAHTAGNIYDVFAFLDSTTLRIGTGPVWSTLTAGSGARGTGAGTTQLTRLNGLLVNAQSMTVRNGASTYTVAGNYGTYLGSIYMDGTNGQVSCHNTYGQSRKWGVWNAYNRVPISLMMGDTTASWAYNTATTRQSQAAAGNTLAVFSGLAEEAVDIRAVQTVRMASGSTTSSGIGIGVNATNAFTGKSGNFISGASAVNETVDLSAAHILAPSAGINNINFCENGGGTATVTFFGTNANMLMTARWMG